MSLLAIYSSPTTPGAAGWNEDVTGVIRLGSITGLSGEAEMGAVGSGNVVLDDVDGTVGHSSDGIVGLKSFYFDELDCPIGHQRLYTAYVADRRYHRGQGDSLITGVARKIDVTLLDLNAFLSFRVFAPTADDPTSDFNRPAETDLERVQALLTDVDFISDTLYDIGYIPTTGGVAMDANDYTGQRPIDVLNDCAQISGRNFWVLYDESSGHLVLWYDNSTTDGTATKTYDSALSLTNVLSEHNGTTVFAITPDAAGVLDPSRVVSAIYDTYTGGTAYRTNPTTANIFAWRDGAPLSSSVKTLAKAQALADRYLLDNATEDERISCTVQVPSSKVTAIHEGMRIQVHFTHIPNVQTGFTWTRILQRTIRQDQETPLYYWLDLELSPLTMLTCSTQVGLISPSDSGSFTQNPTLGAISYPIANTSALPAIVLGGNNMLQIGDTAGNTQIFDAGWTGLIDVSTSGHTIVGAAYHALAGGSLPDYGVTWSFTPPHPAEINCRLMGFSISTAATAPVQTATQIGAGSTCNLTSAPTVGNLFALWKVDEDPASIDPPPPPGYPGPTDWVMVVGGNLWAGTGQHEGMGWYVRCVTEADTVETSPGVWAISTGDNSFSHWAGLSEWALT